MSCLSLPAIDSVEAEIVHVCDVLIRNGVSSVMGMFLLFQIRGVSGFILCLKSFYVVDEGGSHVVD